MKKEKSCYECSTCGRREIVWYGVCPGCRSVGTLKEKADEPQKSKPAGKPRASQKPVTKSGAPPRPALTAEDLAAEETWKRLWKEVFGEDRTFPEELLPRLAGLLKTYGEDEILRVLKYAKADDYHRQHVSPGYIARRFEAIQMDVPTEGVDDGPDRDEVGRWQQERLIQESKLREAAQETKELPHIYGVFVARQALYNGRFPKDEQEERNRKLELLLSNLRRQPPRKKEEDVRAHILEESRRLGVPFEALEQEAEPLSGLAEKLDMGRRFEIKPGPVEPPKPKPRKVEISQETADELLSVFRQKLSDGKAFSDADKAALRRLLSAGFAVDDELRAVTGV